MAIAKDILIFESEVFEKTKEEERERKRGRGELERDIERQPHTL